MALVGPYTANIYLEDEHGERASKRVDIMVDDVTFATESARVGAAMTRAGGLASALDLITDAVITGITLTVPVVEPGLKTVAGDQGVAQLAQVRIYKENGDLYTYPIPAAVAGIFLPDFHTVDPSDGDLQAFFDVYDLAGGVVIQFSDGEQIDTAQGSGGILDGWYATKRSSSRS